MSDCFLLRDLNISVKSNITRNAFFSYFSAIVWKKPHGFFRFPLHKFYFTQLITLPYKFLSYLGKEINRK